MKRNVIRLTESDLHKVIKESVNKVLKEASYDANGNFDAESHNLDLRNKFKSVIVPLLQNIDDALHSLSYYANAATDENLKNMIRIVIDDLMKTDESAQKVYRMINADRWDFDTF